MDIISNKSNLVIYLTGLPETEINVPVAITGLAPQVNNIKTCIEG